MDACAAFGAAASFRAMPKLTVSLPDGTEAVHDLLEELITVGRVEENTIEISDASVSSRHAQLAKDDTDYVLRDLGSTNGTRVNGREAAEGEDFKLSDGDVVIFGNVTVHYSSETPAPSRTRPVEEAVTAAPAAASARPADFSNASPFQTKKKKSDGAGMAIIALGILALLAAGGVIAMVYQMPPPL
jgi:pSer/pThr/pTyr-binding forkhead associated (FHA) protein